MMILQDDVEAATMKIVLLRRYHSAILEGNNMCTVDGAYAKA